MNFSDTTHSLKNVSRFSEAIERRAGPGRNEPVVLSIDETTWLLYALDQLLIAKGGSAQSYASFENAAAKGHGWSPTKERRT